MSLKKIVELTLGGDFGMSAEEYDTEQARLYAAEIEENILLSMLAHPIVFISAKLESVPALVALCCEATGKYYEHIGSPDALRCRMTEASASSADSDVTVKGKDGAPPADGKIVEYIRKMEQQFTTLCIKNTSSNTSTAAAIAKFFAEISADEDNPIRYPSAQRLFIILPEQYKPTGCKSWAEALVTKQKEHALFAKLLSGDDPKAFLLSFEGDAFFTQEKKEQ